jgi:crotonobetainyl-CoA:carnitine CoA-transferase CaiB-like acyl-CoA transferase
VVGIEAPDLPGRRVRQVGRPFHLSETPGQVRHVGSVTGQHTGEVLGSLGYTPEQVAELRRRRMVQ